MHNNALYQLGKEWVTIDRFRKAKGIQSIEPEKEVIEIKEEKIEIVEPELKTKKKK